MWNLWFRSISLSLHFKDAKTKVKQGKVNFPSAWNINGDPEALNPNFSTPSVVIFPYGLIFGQVDLETIQIIREKAKPPKSREIFIACVCLHCLSGIYDCPRTCPGQTPPKGTDLRISFNGIFPIPMENKGIFGRDALSVQSTSEVILNFSFEAKGWAPRQSIYTLSICRGYTRTQAKWRFPLLAAVGCLMLCILEQAPHSWQVSCETCLTLVEKGRSWIQELCG